MNATANPPHALPAPPLARFFIWSHAFDGPLRYGAGATKKEARTADGQHQQVKFRRSWLIEFYKLSLSLKSYIFKGAVMNAKPNFRPVPRNGGWQIHVTWPDARTEQLGGFLSEAEAVQWINNVSDRWTVSASTGTRRRRTRNSRSIIEIIAERLHFAGAALLSVAARVAGVVAVVALLFVIMKPASRQSVAGSTPSGN